MRLYIFFKGLPHYRVPFLERLAEVLPEGWELKVFAARYRNPSKSGYDVLGSQGFRLEVSAGLTLGRGFVHWGFLKEALFGKGDVYVLPGNQGFLAAYPGLLALKLRRKRALVWTMGLSGGALEGLIVSLADGVITYGEVSKRYFEERYSKPVFVARNTVDTESLARRSLELREKGLRFWEGKPKPWVSSVGRFTSEKRPLLLVEAFKRLGRGHLAFVGSGPLLEKARATAGPGVSFTGFLKAEDALPIVAASDLFVRAGTPGLATIEAMALGVPPLVPDAPYPEGEPVVDGVTGYKFKAWELNSLVEALGRALGDPKRAEVARRAQKKVVEEWSLGRMVEGFLAAVFPRRSFNPADL